MQKLIGYVETLRCRVWFRGYRVEQIKIFNVSPLKLKIVSRAIVNRNKGFDFR